MTPPALLALGVFVDDVLVGLGVAGGVVDVPAEGDEEGAGVPSADEGDSPVVGSFGQQRGEAMKRALKLSGLMPLVGLGAWASGLYYADDQELVLHRLAAG